MTDHAPHPVRYPVAQINLNWTKSTPVTTSRRIVLGEHELSVKWDKANFTVLNGESESV